ncbi:spore germination protein [Alteribacillus sp. HJP-4]|uniref:spore germination protein n=1 Tax=Alteribacillus sp. HJP-4 TaxID=2775394 RepID=UPI0035CD077F
MLFRRRKKNRIFAPDQEDASKWLKQLSLNSADFKRSQVSTSYQPFIIYYYSELIDKERLHHDLIRPLKSFPWASISEIEQLLESENAVKTHDVNEINEGIHAGSVVVELNNTAEMLLIQMPASEKREISVPETEFSVIGPQESFVESMSTNLLLVRRRLPISTLQLKELKLGTITKTKTSILYIEGIADEANVNTLMQRLQAIDYDEILDANTAAQMISDHTFSIFPQFVNTERPDRVAAALIEGKTVFMTEGSPEAIVAPSTLLEFFTSLEDYYLPWHIASFIRFLRIGAVLFSVLATPIYVAVMTYHYELIPKDLLSTLYASRSNIPFPPIIEALFLEFTIELLREAGARLPTKVGQTIGIVGGIVIGQASVEAGLTSNILLIVVALAALASFTSPVYQMGNTVRIVRFPFIFGAAWLGGLGIAIAFIVLSSHLLKLTSLGRPYLSPFYPLRIKDWKDSIFRLPYSSLQSRPAQSRPQQKSRVPGGRQSLKRDIDE